MPPPLLLMLQVLQLPLLLLPLPSAALIHTTPLLLHLLLVHITLHICLPSFVLPFPLAFVRTHLTSFAFAVVTSDAAVVCPLCLHSHCCYSQSCPAPAPAVAPTAAVIVFVGGGGAATIAAAAPTSAAAAHHHQFLPPVIHCLSFIVSVSLLALGLGLCLYSPAPFVSVSDTLLVYK